MKLNEIKTVTSGFIDLNEGVIPVHLTLTLGQVLKDNKVTNNVQYFIIAGLIEMFKNGGPHRWPRDLNAYEMATSSESIDEVKNLSDDEAVAISAWLLNCLNSTAAFEKNPFARPQLNTAEWTRWVLRRQD